MTEAQIITLIWIVSAAFCIMWNREHIRSGQMPMIFFYLLIILAPAFLAVMIYSAAICGIVFLISRIAGDDPE